MGQWSVGQKLRGAFIVLTAILLFAGATATSLLWDASSAVSSSGERYLPVMQLSADLERELLQARAQFRDRIAVRTPGDPDAGWEHFRNARGLAPKLRARVAASGEVAEFVAPTEQMIADLSAYEILLGRILDAVKNQQNDGPLFTTLVQDWTRVDGRLADTAAALNAEQNRRASQAFRQNAERLDRSARTTPAVCLLAGILGSLLGWFMARNLNGGLKLAGGELTAAAEQIAAASAEVEAASNLLAGGAADRVGALMDVSACCGKVESIARKGESGTRELASTTARSKQASDAGIEALGRLTIRFNDIAGSSGKMSEIVEVVDTLAFQTNMLAAQAAVEACRSAEVAHALSALATEAGNLARRSAQSARDTAEAVERTSAAVSEGSRHAETVGDNLRIMAAETARASLLADELGAANAEQIQSIDRIAETISRAEPAARAVADGAGQALSASAGIRLKAAAMKKIAWSIAILADGAPEIPEIRQEEPVTALVQT